ncbi:MAG: hypothetical protein Q8N56_03130 [bacterium]|nr:hypothetical protein [bacterium]
MAKLKSRISQEILLKLLAAGKISIPRNVSHSWDKIHRQIFGESMTGGRKFKDVFYYLKKAGLIAGEPKGDYLYIGLTLKGRMEAEKCQITMLTIPRPEKWDGKWRLVMFDIPENTRLIREALRRKLKAFGFSSFQKSAWIYPFPCKKEIDILRSSFGLGKNNLTLFEVDAFSDDKPLRSFFKL